MDLSNLAAGLIVAALDNLPALAVFFLLQIADVVTTVRGLRRGAREANPLMAAVISRLGPMWPVAKILASVLVAALLLISGRDYLLWVMSAIMSAVVINNWRVSR